MNAVNLLQKKYIVLNKEKKSVIWYAICNILQKGIVFLTTPIITRLLTTDEYGVYSVFLSWRDILIIFATLNLFQGVFTKLLVDNKNRQDECTSSIQGLGWCFSALFTIVYFIFRPQINTLLGQDTLSMLCLVLYFFFFPAFSLWCTKQRVNYEYKKMVAATLLITFISPVISIVLLKTTALREDAVIVGSLIVYVVFGILFSILNIYKGKKLYIKTDWMFAVKYNIPLIPHYLSMIILAHSDTIMIKHYCGESKAGIYSLAYQISSMMNVLYIAINNSFVPRSYELLKSKNTNKLKSETEKLLLVMGCLTLCAILVAPELVGIMGGKKYREAIYIIPPVCTALFVTFCYGFFNNVEFYFSETKNVMIASTVSAISNVVLNAIFIPMMGYTAAGYTTLVSYIILAVVHYSFSHKICVREFGIDVYNWRRMSIIIFSVIVCAGVMLSVYNYTVIRYVLVLISLILIIVYKKKITYILKGIK